MCAWFGEDIAAWWRSPACSFRRLDFKSAATCHLSTIVQEGGKGDSRSAVKHLELEGFDVEEAHCNIRVRLWYQ